jgi:hypothetical protein
MLICEKCAEEHLIAENAKLYPSWYGPCEICDEVRACEDVPREEHWAWKKQEVSL